MLAIIAAFIAIPTFLSNYAKLSLENKEFRKLFASKKAPNATQSTNAESRDERNLLDFD